MSAGGHLTFSIPSPGADDESHKILLHLATDDDANQGENETNTGFVMWPAAVLLSRHLSLNPHICRGDASTPDGDIIELGAGCGLTGLVAATLLQNDGGTTGNDDKVIFTDYNPAVLENLRRNILLNDFSVAHEVHGLDWFDQQSTNPTHNDDRGMETRENNTWVDMEGTSHNQCRLILGADLIVCSNDADLVATTIDATLLEGGMAIILGASADARFGVSDFPEACRSLGLDVTIDENILEARESEAGEGDDDYDGQFMDGMELAGHNLRASTCGHDFTMFTVNKPIAAA